jgi:hypothetical protein
MRLAVRVLAILAVCLGVGSAWAAWHALTHATLHIGLHDYGLATTQLLYDTPRGVSLEFLDANGRVLARARTVLPYNYVTAVHPDPAVSDCTQHEAKGVGGAPDPAGYAGCFKRLSQWLSEWTSSVRGARVATATCDIARIPASVTSSLDELWLWWVPLPHVGGTPYRRVSIELFIDSRTCAAAERRAGMPRAPHA